MLKDYADQYYFIDLKVQKNLDLLADAEEFIYQFPAFNSYAIARRYIKVVPNGYYFSHRRNFGEISIHAPLRERLHQNKLLLY